MDNRPRRVLSARGVGPSDGGVLVLRAGCCTAGLFEWVSGLKSSGLGVVSRDVFPLGNSQPLSATLSSVLRLDVLSSLWPFADSHALF